VVTADKTNSTACTDTMLHTHHHLPFPTSNNWRSNLLCSGS